MTSRDRSPRRLLGAALAAALAAVLAGCAGIPTSGPVVAGPEVGLAEPDFILNPAGPQEDAAPADILAGFMTALGSPSGGYQVALEFLTDSLVTTWKPDARTLVRTGVPAVAEVESTATSVRLEYTVDVIGDIDERGRYTETPPSQRTLSYRLVLEDGQWRIGEAPDGVVLSTGAFGVAFQAMPLYFLDPSQRYLVPDLRWFAVRSTTPRRIVEELLLGPADWLQRVVASGFPTGTKLGPQAVEVRTDATASVDLSAAAAQSSSEARAAMRAQLAASLGVATVEISVAGVPLDVPPANPGAPVRDPQPTGSVLVGTGTAFGFGTDSGVVALDAISAAVVADAATAVTVAHDLGRAAYLAGDGSLRTVSVADPVAEELDGRAGLLPPSLDPFGFVWTAQTAPGAPITAVALDGTVTALPVEGLATDFAIASLAISRDGTRLLVTGSSALGTRVLVLGIARADGVPVELTGPLELTAPNGPVVDAAWVDDRSVVVLGGTGGEAFRLLLGGPSDPLGSVPNGVAIVGGSGGVNGIRALAAGAVLAPDSTGDWNDTGLTATFLGTQQ